MMNIATILLGSNRMRLFHDGDMTRFDGRRSLSELEVFIEQVLNNVS